MDTYKYGLNLSCYSYIISGCDVTQIYLPVDMIVFDLQVDRWKRQQEKKHLPWASVILCKWGSLAPLGLCLSFSIIVF
jgi:hypothetical protein